MSGGNSSLRVLRGGSWASILAGDLRSANRFRIAPDRRDSFNGFRVIALARTYPLAILPFVSARKRSEAEPE